jgi:hypothetical protein
MKISELNTIMEEIVFDEIKKAILKESQEGKKEVYHVTCEGEPIVICQTEDEAQEHIDKLKKEHPGKQFIIEKQTYESHDDMIDKLDEMGEQLEEKENTNMENSKPKFKSLAHAIFDAKNKGLKKIKINNESYDVDECWNQMEEEEGQVDEKLVGNQDKLDKNHNGEIDAQDFKILQGQKDEEEECHECGQSMEEEGVDFEKILRGKKEEVSEEAQTCNECGGLMNEEGICNECGGGMYESKKKTLRLTESELVELIAKMVNEATNDSVPQVTKTAQATSKKQNDDAINDMMKDVEKNNLSFEGNDAEFPHQLGSKTKKSAVVNTDEQDEEKDRNFAGLQNLEYDLEPSEQFKKRLKMAIEGDTLMGNAPTTPKTTIKPSNGADKGKEAKEKSGNNIETDTDKKIEKQAKNRAEDKKKRVLYNKESVPVNESKLGMEVLLNEEIMKMKNIADYNKKTQ